LACDAELGFACDGATGLCAGPCSEEALGKSNVGCEYYATATVNYFGSSTALVFAVVISNTTETEAAIAVYQGDTLSTTATVAAGSVQTIALPWTAPLDASATLLAADAAYHIKSTQPVVAQQFNPISTGAYTNDASMLLPVHAWGNAYAVASRNTTLLGSIYRGFYAVVASEDDTTVTLAPSATGAAISANTGIGVAADGTGTVTLDEGDVLQVLSGDTTTSDLTGTLVSADKPIEVFGGHRCAQIPAGVSYCDHLEEAMIPLSALSTSYVVPAPTASEGLTPVASFTRIIATKPNTTLAYDPVGTSATTALAAVGDYVEIDNAAAFAVTANEKILVAQYMKGANAIGTGDPSLSLVVPTDQLRTSALFHAPTSFTASYVTVTAPVSATVTLDGVALTSFFAVGASGYGVARAALSSDGSGTHAIAADQGVGVSVYSYGSDFSSIWSPAGIGLSTIGAEEENTPTALLCTVDEDATFAHDYYYCAFDRTWEGAEAFCAASDMHLVSIADTDENALVLGLLGTSYAYIGASDLDTEGTWTWSDGTAWTWTDTATDLWNAGEPNNSGDEDCAMMIDSSSPSAGLWSDVPCAVTYPFVCESAD